jgi:signal transduction histidine kinase
VTGRGAAGWLAAAALGACCAGLRQRAARADARLEAVADAEHELRGALTAFGLGLDRLARDPVGRRLGRSLDSELERARAALAWIAAARDGRAEEPRSEPLALDRLARSAAAAWQPAARLAGRRVQMDWRAGPVRVRADRGRLAALLGNLLSNAVEHGSGPVCVEATRVGERVRLEVVNGLREADAGPGGARRDPVPGDEPAPVRGRGLRIARSAAESCGGTLSLERGDGRAAAAVELPLAQ